MKRSTLRHSLIVLISTISLLIIWQIAAYLLDLPILLPSPLDAFTQVLRLAGDTGFRSNVGATLLRAVITFVITLVVGVSLGLAAGTLRWMRSALRPIMIVIRTVPVMSIILLAFIWFRSGQVPVFSGFLMAFPLVFQNTVDGVLLVDRQLLEMARVYQISARQRLLHIAIPSVVPSILSGARSALGMSWKVVIAAEVLTVPRFGIGAAMQYAQVRLETVEVIAWTVVAVVMSGLSDLLFDVLAGLFISRRHSGRISDAGPQIRTLPRGGEV